MVFLTEFAAFGFLSPVNRGALGTCAVVSICRILSHCGMYRALDKTKYLMIIFLISRRNHML